MNDQARNHETALQWMLVLRDEFARQEQMELDLNMPTALLAKPTYDILSLSQSQLNFMNMFAIPLFQGVAMIMPELQYTADELERNKALFERKVQEQEEDTVSVLQKQKMLEGTLSPRSMSFAVDMGSEDKLLTDSGSHTPSALVDASVTECQEFSPPVANPVTKPAHLLSLPQEYKEVNGNMTADAFSNLNYAFDRGGQIESCPDTKPAPTTKHRHSEATDGSNSGPYSGEWGSQVTNATTGKMPISPSTQNTSIVSRDSQDQVSPSAQPSSRPQHDCNGTAGSATNNQTTVAEPEPNGTSTRSEGGNTLKKKTSRFRINALNLFRRHMGSSPPPPMPKSDSG